MEFGEKLKVLRKSHNLTHQQLSRLCYNSVSQSAISSWENGIKGGSIGSLCLLADVFGVTTDWLLGRCDNRFNEGVLFRLEPSSFPLSVDFDGRKVQLDFVEFPKEYVNSYYRSQNYTFFARANIVFLLYTLSFEFLDLLSKNKVLFLDGFDKGVKKVVDFYLADDAEENGFRTAFCRLKQVLRTGQPIFLYD